MKLNKIRLRIVKYQEFKALKWVNKVISLRVFKNKIDS